MEIVVVERSFEAPAEFAQLQAAEDRVAWCLEQHRVRFLRSYLSRDGRSMVCMYEAPDAESVRITQRKGGLPETRAFSASLLGGEVHEAEPGRATIVVERDFPEPMSLEEVSAVMGQAGGCLATHRVKHLASYLSRDGQRLVCVFDAHDADSVRMAHRSLGGVVSRAWPATLHTAEK